MSQASLASLVGTRFAGLSLQELVQAPVSALLGVSDEAQKALAGVGISTIFDLGASALFADARRIASASAQTGPLSKFGIASRDWVKDPSWRLPLEAIAALPLAEMRGLTALQASALESGLNVKTIRDLSLWPPHVTARRLVGDVSGATLDADAEQEEALRPRFGDYPTERVYYDRLILLQTQPDGTHREPLHGPISLQHEPPAPTHPLAVGAQVTFSQSWYAQGITLGHLLHSLALAPGEATRIAVVDWSRRSRASDVESNSESDQLSNSMDHGRAVSEIQDATAKELQQGGSQSHSHSSSTSDSAAMSAGTGIGLSMFASADVSGTIQHATSDTDASSSSWSTGNRSVFGQMAQNVNDRTEQNASSVRNRRASAVSEVSQSEHEQVSTRIVANYNHMHALTVQYFEVVQVYRVATQVQQIQRCLFVPLAPLNFSGPEVDHLIERFRGAFLRRALSRRALELLLDHHQSVAIMPESPIKMPGVRRLVRSKPKPEEIRKDILKCIDLERELEREREATSHSHVHNAKHLVKELELRIKHVRAEIHRLEGLLEKHHGFISSLFWSEKAIAEISQIVLRPVARPGSHALFLPDDAELLAISIDGVHLKSISLDVSGAGRGHVVPVHEHAAIADIDERPRLSHIHAISVSKAEAAPAHGSITLLCSYLGRHFSSPPIPFALGEGTRSHKVASFKHEAGDRRAELIGHLRNNQAHYSEAAFRSLDNAAISGLLSRYSWNGRPLLDQIDPKPLSVNGNYLVFKAPAELTDPSGIVEAGRMMSWGELLDHKGLDMGQTDQRLIPVPSSGVFAEAVLGRSNSAEKLDVTRFWNWQDSPIPFAPTDISPVSTGSRATMEEAHTGNFSQPMVGMMNPTELPNPTGVGAVLGAVSNGNMFRDMSGLAGTQALAQSTMQGTLQATTAAGQLASANMQTEAQKSVAMGQIAADLVKSLMGGGGGGGGTSVGGNQKVQGISATGAAINHAATLDAQGVPVPGSTGGASPTRQATGGGSSASGGSASPNQPGQTWTSNAHTLGFNGYSAIGAAGAANLASQLASSPSSAQSAQSVAMNDGASDASTVPIMFGSPQTPGGVFAGFDKDYYPGDSVMASLKQTNLSWVAFYLTPSPSQGHDLGWMSKRAYLASLGWGFAPLYVGEQTTGAHNSLHPSAQKGTLDAADAVQLAQTAGFPAGSVIYLDIENGPPNQQTMLDYAKSWFAGVLSAGYTPGVYCSYLNANDFANLNPAPVIWVWHVSGLGGSYADPFPAPNPAASGAINAMVLQHRQAATITWGQGQSLVNVDLDTALVADPSQPGSM